MTDVEKADLTPVAGVTEGPGQPEPTTVDPSADSGVDHGSVWALTLSALGIVYGDIGTSPLYAIQSVFGIDHGAVRPTTGDVFGVASLVFWSITVIVSIKYVFFILRADNDGEGGVMALAALVRQALASRGGRWAGPAMLLGVFGASLFYGDSVITPAISVMSAVEGLNVVAPHLSEAVVPIAAIVLTLLFASQRVGSQRVGGLFGPVMLLWFTALGTAGAAQLVRHPAILRGLSPSYAVLFIADHPYIAFIAMGAIVLSITGAEALYADMGHFGRAPIRRAWFLLVFPALTLNYLAQGDLILRNPSARSNPFYLLVPGWAQIPMLVLATVATVIASQAVISGAFSVSRQAVRLGFLPHVRVRQTSEREIGQVYVPGINWGLYAAVMIVVFTFQSSTRLATAYGVAVTGTFLITTALFLTIARRSWHWAVWKLVLAGVGFGFLELIYFSANLTKIVSGGWLTVLIALGVFTVMTTWDKGREIVTASRKRHEGDLMEFIAELHQRKIPRVPGVAVFPHPYKETTPLALRANVEHNGVLHSRVVIISGRTANIPHIPWERRLKADTLGDPDDGIVHIAVEFGFQDRTDFAEVLRRASADNLVADVDPDQVSYFLSRITIRRNGAPDEARKDAARAERDGADGADVATMATWRKRLFIGLAHNAASQADFLCLPDERTVVMGSHIVI